MTRRHQDVRETLRRFYADPESFGKAMDLADEDYREKTAAFVDTLASFGIERSEIQVADFEVFRHAGFAAAVEAFIASNPLDPLPMEKITIAHTVRLSTCEEDFAAIERDLRAQAERVRHFATRFNVDVVLHIFLEALDPDRAIALAELAVTSRLDALGFYYQFAEMTEADAARLRAAAARLCEHPAMRDPRVTVGNFPFCFLPPSHFPLAYREALEPLKGQITAQRALVREQLARTDCALAVCRACRCQAACHTFTEVASHPACEPLLIPRQQSAVLFAGGSVSQADAPADPDLVWTGPAEQGDLLAAVLEGFETILLVDGFFHTRFPCTTFEVMLALEAGARVLGSSSIGALRAVELDRHGMEGVGYVYEHLKRQAIKPYHVVAQTYDEAHRQFTPALIQLLYVLERAEAEGALAPAEAAQARAGAERTPFPALSWDLLPPAAAAYRARVGAAALDIKRQDALALLDRFRSERTRRPIVPSAYEQARARYLERLTAKLRANPDLALPEGWRTRDSVGAPARAGSDARGRRAAETVERAARFFEDLDVVLADTSRFDPSSQFILSAFFPPFYHLGYSPSSATGNGDDFHAALASAYMELLERLPAAAGHLVGSPADAWSEPRFPAADLPPLSNSGLSEVDQGRAADTCGFVRATDIVTGRDTIIPQAAVLFRFSGTDGHASGNSLPEAILYGLYELVERDTCQLHVSDAELRRRKPEFLADPDALADDACRELLREAESKGCRLLLYRLPNLYDLPCVLCEVYDGPRAIQCHGGVAVRADVRAAAGAAVREAYMQYITYFAGTRDDYRAHAPLKRARLAYENARALWFHAPGARVEGPRITFPTIESELQHVLDRLTGADIEHVLVADLSPPPPCGLHSVKVIVPRLELWFCPAYRPSRFRDERLQRLKAML